MCIDIILSYTHSSGQLGFPRLQAAALDRRQAVSIYADVTVTA